MQVITTFVPWMFNFKSVLAVSPFNYYRRVIINSYFSFVMHVLISWNIEHCFVCCPLEMLSRSQLRIIIDKVKYSICGCSFFKGKFPNHWVFCLRAFSILLTHLYAKNMCPVPRKGYTNPVFSALVHIYLSLVLVTSYIHLKFTFFSNLILPILFTKVFHLT